MQNPFSLENKTVLVTGASSGIGRSIAIECSNMGANVVITGRDRLRLEETMSMLNSGVHELRVVDLTNLNDLESFVESLPQLDGVVNNAGIIQQTLIKFLDTDEINQQLEINLLAPIHLTRLLVQYKKIRKGASILFISSINGNNCAYIGSSIYGATKSGLSGFMKEVALELAPRNIRVNCINPGMIETNLLEGGNVDKSDLQQDMIKYPLKRYGKPQEVAYAAIYLLSDATQWITGSSLLIDGGYTLQ